MRKYRLFILAICISIATQHNEAPARSYQLPYEATVRDALLVDTVPATNDRSHEARTNVNYAVTYLDRSALARKVIRCAENHGVKIVVTASRTGYDHIANRISWDGRKAAAFADGGSQSPALVLLHELGHACDYGEDPETVAERTSIDDPRYSNEEERYVITKIETRVAKDLREDVRNDHDGRFYHVESPVDR